MADDGAMIGQARRIVQPRNGGVRRRGAIVARGSLRARRHVVRSDYSCRMQLRKHSLIRINAQTTRIEDIGIVKLKTAEAGVKT